MKKINYKSLFFNITEAIIVFSVGFLIIRCSIKNMLIVTALFVYVRETIGDAKHYKNPIKCMIWSLFLMESLFIVMQMNFFIGIGATILAGIIMSRGGDTNLFEYHNDENQKKYKEMKKYISENENAAVVKEFEETLKMFDITYKERFKISAYKVYNMYFIKSATFKQMRNELDIYDNHGIIKILDMIFMSFNTYMMKNDMFKEIKEGN